MHEQDNAFVTMLLTMSLSANREEYAHPLSTPELRRLEERVRKYGVGRIGKLLNLDISGLILKLDIAEEEAYRIFTLLNRSVQLTYAVEELASKYGIGVINCHESLYPSRLTKKLREAAPPILYYTGNTELLHTPMLSIIGISGVKTTQEIRDSVRSLVEMGTAAGYTILAGGEPGVSRLTANLTAECGGKLVSVLGGEMAGRIREEPIAGLLEQQKALVLSVEHPLAMFTISHAITRNKVMFALSEAAFILNTDGKRGESEALRNGYCDWIYAWTGYKENKALINRGAIAITDISGIDLKSLSRHWQSGESEQMNMFDLL